MSYQWRKLFPGAVRDHVEFMAEVDSISAAWDVALANLDNALQEEHVEAMQREAERKRR